MTYIFEIGNPQEHTYTNAVAIANALYYYGKDVVLWSPTVIPHRQMVVEKSPKIVFHHSPVSDKFKSFAESHGVRLVDITTEFAGCVSDLIMFKQHKPSPVFQTRRLIILQYPKIENTKSYALGLTLSQNYSHRCKIFSILPLNGAKYCGWLPQEYHALAYSSADEIVTLSPQTAVNASLCNDNVFLENQKFNISPEDRRDTSNLWIARKYIDEDTGEMYDKFFTAV